ncbi:MAG: DUF4185 domain-containing protein [Runella sp.]
MKYLIATILLIWAFSVHGQKMQYHRPMPYPQSKFIKKFEWTSQPVRYPGTGSDMHWHTWGIDDAIYIVDDDGANFGGPANYAHVLKITGIPPFHQVETITDFENYDFRVQIPRKLLRRYVNGILAVDSTFYVCLYDYDWNLPSKVWDFDDLWAKAKMFNPWPIVTPQTRERLSFIDSYSKHAGIAGIIRSKDFGKTWDNLPDSTPPPFLGPRFAGMSFVTWGAGYSNAPQELGEYVYGISNDSNWESGDHIYLARVHRDSVLVRKAWQFFAGMKGKKPLWILHEAASKPIFSDAGHVGHPTLTFNKALDRYILLVCSDVVPHREDATPEEQKKWDYASELQLYESKSIFGPWRIFYNEAPWGGADHTCYLPQMPTKWISDDGLSGSIMFAGDYTHRKGEYYGLMTQQYRIWLFKSKL